jgi:hypothetical protein
VGEWEEGLSVKDFRQAFSTYKGTEQYLDAEDRNQMTALLGLMFDTKPITVLELLKAVEDLRNHLRRKYFAG